MDTPQETSPHARTHEREPPGSAFEAVRQPNMTIEPADSSLVTIRSPRPGELVAGKGIFVGEFDLVDHHGYSVGIPTRWYDAAIEFGERMMFEEAVDAIAKSDLKERGGLRLDTEQYEADLFRKLATGEALGKHVMAPLAVVREIFNLRNSGQYRRMSVENSPGKLTTDATDTRAGKTTWQWSCTSNSHHTAYLWVVDFSDRNDERNDGEVYRHNRDGYRFSARACFAELVP